MNKQPEDWLDDVPENKNDDDDEIIWVSKSEIKRDAEALKDLGTELVDLGKNALERIPLDEDLLAAIELAQKIKKEGRRRQLQLIGKMLRARDVEPIQTALDKLKNRHNQQISLFHKLETLRDRLIAEGDEAIPTVLELYPDADRQQLRSLVRNAQKEQAANKPPKSFRQIFSYLRELAEKNSNRAGPGHSRLPTQYCWRA
ncbi:ribosome-associated protein [Yersinia pestis]|nr:ribosome biogenesis factor YjgA [Yersinia pestis]MBI0184232.1 ribosome-associated protein [Yersinia pestis subsp. pestis]KAA5782660.1 ribosome-associated protein [Yersinia pestis]KKM55873.1 hypothetical protein VT69_15285 [Yersinia pestis]NSL63037.1 ribosome-associated protein [Yersinia pestis]PVF13806.1 ribosome-associated protein [Yersinia pestis]